MVEPFMSAKQYQGVCELCTEDGPERRRFTDYVIKQAKNIQDMIHAGDTVDANPTPMMYIQYYKTENLLDSEHHAYIGNIYRDDDGRIIPPAILSEGYVLNLTYNKTPIVDALTHPVLQEYFRKATTYRKTAKTLLRTPHDSEIGTNFVTYVQTEGAPRRESASTITPGCVIARNPDVIGMINDQPVYNEWVIPQDVARKNYSQENIDALTADEYTPVSKKGTITAIPLTEELVRKLGGDEAVLLKVSWSPEPMRAVVGDYLTTAGYSISSKDMEYYEVVRPSAPDTTAAPR